MTPGPVDDERPGLAREPPFLHPFVDPAGRIVLVVDLDVDETDTCALELRAHLVQHVDDRPADAAEAERRRGKGHNEGDGGLEGLLHRVAQELDCGRALRRDLSGLGIVEGRVLARERPVSDRRRDGVGPHLEESQRLHVRSLRLGDEPVHAGLVKGDARDVEVLDVELRGCLIGRGALTGGVGGCPGTARCSSDRDEARLRLRERRPVNHAWVDRERCLLQCVAEPVGLARYRERRIHPPDEDAGGWTEYGTRITSKHEEGHAVLSKREIRHAGHHCDVLAGPAEEEVRKRYLECRPTAVGSRGLGRDSLDPFHDHTAVAGTRSGTLRLGGARAAAAGDEERDREGSLDAQAARQHASQSSAGILPGAPCAGQGSWTVANVGLRQLRRPARPCGAGAEQGWRRAGSERAGTEWTQFRDAFVTHGAKGVRLSGLPSPGGGEGLLICGS